jgi:hypothetical protein
MSKTGGEPKDNFSAIEEFYSKCFIDMEQYVPHFQHEFFNLQNEYYKVWKNILQANILLQKEFVNKTEFFIPESAMNVIKGTNEEIARARALRDSISVSAIDAIKKNIKTLSNNADIFAEYNKKMFQFWITAFMSDRKH